MTAQQCFDQVQAARREENDAQRVRVHNAINKAVQLKYFNTSVDGHLDASLIRELREAGFEVTTGSQYNESYTLISWQNPS